MAKTILMKTTSTRKRSLTDAALEATQVDPLIQRMRMARDSPSLLKLELARRRSTETTLPFIVLEGDDDKIIYTQWFGRLRPSLQYALFPCRGKGRVLELLDIIRRDATGLGRGVYFFVDRDFDGLKQRSPGTDIYMTDSYSVENYLVSDEVLDRLLQVEFHCHSCIETRHRILEIFNNYYDCFLEVTAPVNLRLFKARHCAFPTGGITDTLGKVASVSVGRVQAGTADPDEIIKIEGVFEKELEARLESDFASLDPRLSYRGKFALAFFKKWLRDLGERHRPGDGLFEKIDNRSAFRLDELTLNSLASKSGMPAGLLEYVSAIEGVAE